MMIDVIRAVAKYETGRVGVVTVKYYDLHIYCDVVMYKENHLWIRMPEVWEKGVTKKRFCFWESQEQSDQFQNIILGKVFDLIGLDISKAIELKKQYYADRNAVAKT